MTAITVSPTVSTITDHEVEAQQQPGKALDASVADEGPSVADEGLRLSWLRRATQEGNEALFQAGLEPLTADLRKLIRGHLALNESDLTPAELSVMTDCLVHVGFLRSCETHVETAWETADQVIAWFEPLVDEAIAAYDAL